MRVRFTDEAGVWVNLMLWLRRTREEEVRKLGSRRMDPDK